MPRDTWLYRPLAVLVGALGRVLARTDVRGAHHVPRSGPGLVVANHISHLDTIVLFAALSRLGRRPRFTAHAGTWAVGILGWLFEQGGVIPVHHGEGPERFAADVLAFLDAGELVVVYPEGTIPRSPQDRRARPGAGLAAARSTAPVVPVAMAGIAPWTGFPMRLRQPATVTFGAPMQVPPLAPDASRDAQIRTSEALLDRIDQFLPAPRT
ncbi:MAG: 1-acyl-sn-glycerol-3-phosphate acyltransferase [Actinobacteria bacterium]|nr:1-acyl-sn-glycerol-3-phosphate acyltransferase [Actinomycetota bacterium]